MPTPTISQLKQAIAIAEEIAKLQADLASLVGGSSSGASAPTAAKSTPIKIRGRRKMSPDTIAKMRAAQQARWAKKKGTVTASSPVEAPAKVAKAKAGKPGKRKTKLSPEGRARIVAALKARWAAKKKAAK